MGNYNILPVLLKKNSNRDIASQSSKEIMELVREYARLRFNCKTRTNEEKEERLNDILAIAEKTPLLGFWITEVDHVLAHQQGLLNEDACESYKDQYAILYDYISLTQFQSPEGTRQDNSSSGITSKKQGTAFYSAP